MHDGCVSRRVRVSILTMRTSLRLTLLAVTSCLVGGLVTDRVASVSRTASVEAAAFYLQKGPTSATRPTLSANQVEMWSGSAWSPAGFGTGSGSFAQGNDTRFPPAPSGAGKMLWDTGSAWNTFGPCAANTLAQGNGAASPTCVSTITGVSHAGVYTLGGTPTLGANLAAAGFKVTGLGTPTAASTDAATAAYAEAQKTGSVGPVFHLNVSQGWGAGQYLGIDSTGDGGTSALSVNITPWLSPCAGTLRNMCVYGFSNVSGSTVITLYKTSGAVGLTPSYSSTSLTMTLLSGNHSQCDIFHTVSVAQGDLVVGFSDAAWSANGLTLSAQLSCN